jgi:hypothetical protein
MLQAAPSGDAQGLYGTQTPFSQVHALLEQIGSFLQDLPQTPQLSILLSKFVSHPSEKPEYALQSP